MNPSDVPLQEEGGLEYALRVLRVLGPRGGVPRDAKTIGALPRILVQGMELADREYDRLLSSIDPEYYHEFAVPTHIEIDESTAEDLRSSLEMRQEFPGVLGPESIHHEGKVYKVWIQVFPCG